MAEDIEDVYPGVTFDGNGQVKGRSLPCISPKADPNPYGYHQL